MQIYILSSCNKVHTPVLYSTILLMSEFPYTPLKQYIRLLPDCTDTHAANVFDSFISSATAVLNWKFSIYAVVCV